MTWDDQGTLQPRTVRASVPRDGIPGPRDLRLTRGRLTVVLAVAAWPLAQIAHVRYGIDDHLVFAGLWAAAVLLQRPDRRFAWDWLATAALVIYLLSFALPAGIAGDELPGAPGRLRGVEVLLEPPVSPLRHLPEGELVALVVGMCAWVANPAFVVALALFRHREATVAMVVAAAAVMMGLFEVPAADLAIGHLAWLGSAAILAVAAAWSRTEFH